MAWILMSQRVMRRLPWLVFVVVGACATDDPSAGDSPPQPPGKEDSSSYQVSGARSWYLVGDALTDGNDRMELAITGPGHYVDLWLDGHYVTRAHASSGSFALSVDLAELATGAHDVLLAADGSHYAFAELPFQRSYPLYIDVTNDWDTSDHGDDKLARQDRLHANHPQMVMTHFVGPYTFTDPATSPARAAELVAWVNGYRAKGDEVGLHIHPYCNFVTTAGVTCRTSPSFAYANGDTTGYTVILASYTQSELEKMFAKADALFTANGLPKPTSFRAGGWTANLDVIEALATAHHLVDASACNWARLEEWQDNPGATIYQWNMQHWSSVNETTQPYYPSTSDILADAGPHVPVLEIPDNGALVDYVTANEMISMFRSNFSGDALPAARVYSIGYHPVDFSDAFFARIDTAMTEIDKHLAADDHGPVIYARISDLAKVWPAP